MARVVCVSTSPDIIPDLGPAVLEARRIEKLLMGLCFLLALKFCTQAFPYLRSTFYRVATFVPFMFLVMLPFAVLVYHCFGSAIATFNSPWNAFVGVYLAFGGNIDLDNMRDNSPILGTLVFFLLFLVFAMIMASYLAEVIDD